MVEEFRRLERAAAALERGVSEPSPSPHQDGGAANGRRARQALDLVTARPGITTAELAEAMAIKPNYLYRLMPKLKSEGKVCKRGKGWRPA